MTNETKLPSEEKEAEYRRLAEFIDKALWEAPYRTHRPDMIRAAIVRFYAEEKQEVSDAR